MRHSVTSTVFASSTCLALVMAGACEREPGAETTPQTIETPQAPQASATAEVHEIKDSPGQFYGGTVTLAGEIEELRGERGFVLEGDGSWFGDEILVVTRTPVRFGARGMSEGDDVLVKGKVQRMMVAELERELGWDLSTELEVEFREKPVVVATSIRAVEDTARWSEAEAPKGVITSVTAFDGVQPDALVGQSIQLDSVPVQAKTGKGLWVGYRHRSMLLVAPPEGTDLASIEVGDAVSVQGQLATMPAAEQALQRWGIDPTLRTQVEQEPLYLEATAVRRLDATGQRGGGQHAQAQQGPQAGETVELGQFARAPQRYVGRSIHGEAAVTKVFSDRGFWLRTEDGSTILAIVREDVPRPEMIDIDEGQRLRLTGDALAASSVDEVAGTLEPETKQAIRAQGTFLSTHWRNIEILDPAAADGAMGRGR